MAKKPPPPGKVPPPGAAGAPGQSDAVGKFDKFAVFALAIPAVVLAISALFFGVSYTHDHMDTSLLGFVPGPLYDEALAVTPALAWFRLETLLLALTVIVWPALMLDMKSGALTRPHVRPGAALLLLGLLAGIFALEERGPQLGTRMNEAVLEEKLGGRRETDHFVLHYPRGKPGFTSRGMSPSHSRRKRHPRSGMVVPPRE